MTTGPNDSSCVVWAFGEFSYIFFIFFLVFNDLHRYYQFSKGTVGLTQATTMSMGPNDMSHVIWVLVECFLSFSFVSFIFIVIQYYNARNLWKGSLKVQKGVWKATMRITGPNNVRHIIWALGECFFILFPSYFNGFYRLPLVLGVEAMTTDVSSSRYVIIFCLFYL